MKALSLNTYSSQTANREVSHDFSFFFSKGRIPTTCFLNIGNAQKYLCKGAQAVWKSQQQHTQQQKTLKLLFVFSSNPSSVKQNAIHIWLHANYGRCHTGWQDLLKCSAHECFRLTIRQCARTAAYSEPTSSESLEKQSVWKVGEKKKQTTPNAVTLKERGKYEDGQK